MRESFTKKEAKHIEDVCQFWIVAKLTIVDQHYYSYSYIFFYLFIYIQVSIVFLLQLILSCARFLCSYYYCFFFFSTKPNAMMRLYTTSWFVVVQQHCLSYDDRVLLTQAAVLYQSWCLLYNNFLYYVFFFLIFTTTYAKVRVYSAFFLLTRRDMRCMHGMGIDHVPRPVHCIAFKKIRAKKNSCASLHPQIIYNKLLRVFDLF